MSNVATREQFDSFKEGKTTRAQIRESLGKPFSSSVGGSQECDTYTKQDGAFSSKLVMNSFCFDSNGVLTSKNGTF